MTNDEALKLWREIDDFVLRFLQPKPPVECDHHAYEKRCALCPFVEIKTDWMTFGKPPAAPAGVTCCLCAPHVGKCAHCNCEGYDFWNQTVKSKPPPPTERCQHENHRNKLPCPDCGESPVTDQAVEEKITSIVSAYSPNNSFRPALRASLVNLVLLARGGKG